MNASDGPALESARIAAWLRDAIVVGVRAPGSRLIERELAAEFGVSRVPVRDALKILEAERLVELRPRTWAIVRAFTDHDLDELDEVRRVIEPLAFQAAAERHPQQGRDRLGACLREQQEALRSGDLAGSRRAAAEFHEIVVDLTGNSLLRDLMGGVRGRVRWGLAQQDDLQRLATEHLALFDAISARDGDRAAQLAREHIERSRDARLAARRLSLDS